MYRISTVIDTLGKDELLTLRQLIDQKLHTIDIKTLADKIKLNLDPDNRGYDGLFFHHQDISGSEYFRYTNIVCLTVPYRVNLLTYNIEDITMDEITIEDCDDITRQPPCVQHFKYEIDVKYLETLKLKSDQIPKRSWNFYSVGSPWSNTTTIDVYIYYTLKYEDEIKDGNYFWIKEDGSMTEVTIKDGKMINPSDDSIIDSDIDDCCLISKEYREWYD